MFAYRILSAALLCLAATGCTSNRLAEPIGKFAEITTAAAKNINEQQGLIVKATQDRATDTVIMTGAPVVPYEGDCSIDDPEVPRCRLRAFVTEGDAWPYSDSAFEDATGTLINGIVAYANNLAAIAGAGSQAEIEAATSAARANTLKLAGTTDTIRKQQGAASQLQANITPYAAPVAELVTFGLQQLVEAKRYKALRAATRQMVPVLHEAVMVFNEIAEEGVRLKLLSLQNAFNTAEDAYQRDTKSRAKLASYKLAAENLDAALQTPADVMTKLEEAHNALVVALERRDKSFQDLWPPLQELAESAAKLATIGQQLDAAGKAN